MVRQRHKEAGGRRCIASVVDGSNVAGTEVIGVEFFLCFRDLMPLTGIAVQLHNPVRETFFLPFYPVDFAKICEYGYVLIFSKVNCNGSFSRYFSCYWRTEKSAGNLVLCFRYRC